MSRGSPYESSSTQEFDQHSEEQHAFHVTTGHNHEGVTTHGALVPEQDGYVWFVECGGFALLAIIVVFVSKITKNHPKGRPR